MDLPAKILGFPDGASGKESSCQCRRHETRVRSLGQRDPLEEGMATDSSVLAWRIPMDRGALWAIVQGVTKTRTQLKGLSTHACSQDNKCSFLKLPCPVKIKSVTLAFSSYPLVPFEVDAHRKGSTPPSPYTVPKRSQSPASGADFSDSRRGLANCKTQKNK